jgi:glycosidase
MAAILLAASCCNDRCETGYEVPAPEDVMMYQVNPRVFAPEKSFNAVAQHLDSIKALGTNVVWFMPIYPVGQIKTVNSPYCISDYKGVNPEFGTLEEFKNVVSLCHEKGMSVIVDWVANHTSWDNKWIESNPEWYTHEDGQIVPPIKDWADVADLNFDNPEMRLAMIDAMKFWVTEVGIDGFRCDAADFVPFDFWKQCCDSLRAIPDHKLLLLAEGKRKDHFDAGFEMNYAWDYLAATRAVFNGGRRGPAQPATMLFEADSAEYAGVPQECVKLRFTTNHDESDKMSPIKEFGGERGSMAAFVASTFIHGGALVYGSQEIGYPGRINFFRYVPMDWEANPALNKEYTDLLALYNSIPAIRKGEMTPYPDADVLKFSKSHEGDSVLVLVNVRHEDTYTDTPAEWVGKECTDLMTGNKIILGDKVHLDPYEYIIMK